MISRREVLLAGGALLAGLGARRARAEDALLIVMEGDALGSDVWFDPIGLLVPPGGTVGWRNDDPANSHTTTAYHPENRHHPLRIPSDAKPWNSGYLLPGETFSVTFTVPGVYDFFCIPHEMAGMVGRIVVTAAGSAPPEAPSNDRELMEAARGGFPSIDEIMRLGAVHRK